MAYYIFINNTSVGPMDARQLLSYPVNADTPVSHDGADWKPLYTYPELQQQLSQSTNIGNKKLVAGLLAIFLGFFGVQYFYLGKTSGGFICLLLSIITCGAWEIVTLIQGILMICMDDNSFRQKYIDTSKTFPLF